MVTMQEVMGERQAMARESIQGLSTEDKVILAISCAQRSYMRPEFQQWAASWLDGTDRTAAAACQDGLAPPSRDPWVPGVPYLEVDNPTRSAQYALSAAYRLAYNNLRSIDDAVIGAIVYAES